MNESDPLIRRLADANPVPPPEVEGASRSPSADRLLAQLFRRRWRFAGSGLGHTRRRWVAVGGSLLVAMAAVGLILRAGGEAPATASELLLRTAAVAADREAPIEDGAYLYTKIQTDQLTTSIEGDLAWSVVLPVVEETWVAADGSGRIRSVIGEPRFLGPRDFARWQAAGSPEFPSGVSDDVLPAGVLAYEDVAALPTDPGELASALREEVASEDLPSEVAVFLRVGELLASAGASPELRAALYRVASELPGVVLVGGTSDPNGRPGVAVATTYEESGAAVRVLMIFDQETSVLLAQEQILLERASWLDAEPGTPFTFVVYLETGRTNSVRALPAVPSK